MVIKVIYGVVVAVCLIFIVQAEMKIYEFETHMGINTLRNELMTEQEAKERGSLLMATMLVQMGPTTRVYYKGRNAFIRNVLH